jgi:hypothetical protein
MCLCVVITYNHLVVVKHSELTYISPPMNRSEFIDSSLKWFLYINSTKTLPSPLIPPCLWFLPQSLIYGNWTMQIELPSLHKGQPSSDPTSLAEEHSQVEIGKITGWGKPKKNSIMSTAQLKMHYVKDFSTCLTHAQILWEVELKEGVVESLA